MATLLYCTVYILFFSYLILKSPCFRLPGFKNAHTLAVFYLKLLSGVALWGIYTYHYHNRIASDIFKSYDDSKIIYNARYTHFADFLKLLTGISGGSAHINSYYRQMNSWGNDYGSTLFNNSHFIIRLNALFMFFSDGHYGVHVIFFCFLSLTGLVLIYKSFYPALASTPKMLFAAVFLFPSVLLWGSGVLKEGLVFLGLGLSVYYFRQYMNRHGKKIINILLVLMGMVLLFETKAYVLVCILPCFIAWYIAERIDYAKKHLLITYFSVTAIYLGIGLNTGRIAPIYNPVKMLVAKQDEFNHITRGGLFLVKKNDSTRFAYLPASDTSALEPASAYSDSLLHHEGLQYLASESFGYKEKITGRPAYFTIRKGVHYILARPATKDTLKATGNDSTLYGVSIFNLPAKSMIKMPPLKPTLAGLAEGIPRALYISVMRPSLTEIHSGAMLIYLIENHIVILLILIALVFCKRKNLPKNEIAFCLTWCLLMLVLIGLVTPVYGGIERYKAVVMPFLLILLLLVYDNEKLKRILKRRAKT